MTFQKFFRLAVLAITSAAAGHAQVVNGDLVGTVTDRTGGLVPDAAVEALNDATGVRYTGKASEAGQYRIANVPAGSCRVSASAPGFATAALVGVKVDANKTATVNVMLDIGKVAESLEVTAAAAVIDTTTATIQN